MRLEIEDRDVVAGGRVVGRLSTEKPLSAPLVEFELRHANRNNSPYTFTKKSIPLLGGVLRPGYPLEFELEVPPWAAPSFQGPNMSHDWSVFVMAGRAYDTERIRVAALPPGAALGDRHRAEAEWRRILGHWQRLADGKEGEATVSSLAGTVAGVGFSVAVAFYLLGWVGALVVAAASAPLIWKPARRYRTTVASRRLGPIEMVGVPAVLDAGQCMDLDIGAGQTGPVTVTLRCTEWHHSPRPYSSWAVPTVVYEQAAVLVAPGRASFRVPGTGLPSCSVGMSGLHWEVRTQHGENPSHDVLASAQPFVVVARA